MSHGRCIDAGSDFQKPKAEFNVLNTLVKDARIGNMM